MDELCRGQVRNVIFLVDSFEDTDHYFTVTKHMPHGDLLNYFIHACKTAPLGEDAVRDIMR